jgi:hypothetical protein
MKENKVNVIIGLLLLLTIALLLQNRQLNRRLHDLEKSN